MKLTVSIQMDGAAFEYAPGEEAARILEVAANHARGGGLEIPLEMNTPEDARVLMDLNGNTIGRVIVTRD